MTLESEAGEIKIIDSFKGEYDWLSNFYPVVIHSSGFNFQSVEIAYQASKTNNYSDWAKFAALGPDDSGKSKAMGRKVKLIRNWDLKKISIMKRFLYQKFMYDVFKEKLLATGQAQLIEVNYWHDNYWGDCKCKKCTSKPGFNTLGKLLMEIRENL